MKSDTAAQPVYYHLHEGIMCRPLAGVGRENCLAPVTPTRGGDNNQNPTWAEKAQRFQNIGAPPLTPSFLKEGM